MLRAPQLGQPGEVPRDGGVAVIYGREVVVDDGGADGARDARHRAQPAFEPRVDALRVEEVAARAEPARLLPRLEGVDRAGLGVELVRDLLQGLLAPDLIQPGYGRRA